MEKWQKHVRVASLVPHRMGDLTACGQTVRPTEWTFDGEEHARRNVDQGKPLRPCPACARVLGIVARLRACRRYELVLTDRGELRQVRDTRASSDMPHRRMCMHGGCDRRAHYVQAQGEGDKLVCSNHVTRAAQIHDIRNMTANELHAFVTKLNREAT